MIVVDSSVWIAQLRGHHSVAVEKLQGIRHTSQIIVGDVVLLEVLQGARNELEAEQVEEELRSFDVQAMLDGQLATIAAANYRALRHLGVTIRKTADIIIATFCIERGHVLLQQDRDFLPMADVLGLRLA